MLVPARARLELVTVEPLDMEPEYAFQIALANRLDFMNGRAALVDRWRLIEVSADALQSVLDVTANGNLRTARNNPLSFRAPTGNLRMGLEFDAPMTRLLERNAYRETLIEYQRSRRSFIQSRDELHLGIRALLRQIEQLRQDLEIQRRAVAIAIRQVDQTQLDLNPPRLAPQPGTRPPINPTTAINLLVRADVLARYPKQLPVHLAQLLRNTDATLPRTRHHGNRPRGSVDRNPPPRVRSGCCAQRGRSRSGGVATTSRASRAPGRLAGTCRLHGAT